MGSQIVMSGIQAMQAHKIKEAIAKGRLKQGLTVAVLLVAALVWQGSLRAAEADMTMPLLEDVTFSTLPGFRVQVELVMSAPVNVPRSFTTDTPARIALDFPDTTSNLAKKSQVIGIGSVRGVTAVQGDSRLRVVVDLVKMTPYQTRVDGKHFYITVDSADSGVVTASAEPQAATSTPATTKAPYQITTVDFRRGERGEGRVTIALANAATPVNVREEGGKVMVDFAGTNLPKDLQRRLDVVDFATPVTTIDAFTVGHDVRLVISATGNYEHLAYQTDRQFTVEVKPVTKAAQEQRKKEEAGYTGEKLSLNFQDIEVRAAVQIIADFTSLNIVVSDAVKGSISLRLIDVPWDQALDLILKTKSLGMRKIGNVMLVAPSADIAAREN